jgi:hypothetical protein
MDVMERLLGPSYFYHRHLIKQSKRWSLDQIRDYQEWRIRRLTHRYGNGVTQKDDYRQDLCRYTVWDVPPLTHFVRTGGTSFQRPGFLRLQIVTSPGADRGKIQRTFERHLPMASLEFEYVLSIQRSPSGKRKYFVDGSQA